MAKPYIPQIGVPVALQYFAARVVALVSAGRENALFEVRRIRSVEEHVLVVVCLDDQVVCRADIRLHLFVHAAAVGHDHKALAEVINTVSHALGGVVLDVERIDLHAEQLPLFAFLEIAPAGTQLLAHAVVAVYTLMDQSGGINRQMDALS